MGSLFSKIAARDVAILQGATALLVVRTVFVVGFVTNSCVTCVTRSRRWCVSWWFDQASSAAKQVLTPLKYYILTLVMWSFLCALDSEWKGKMLTDKVSFLFMSPQSKDFSVSTTKHFLGQDRSPFHTATLPCPCRACLQRTMSSVSCLTPGESERVRLRALWRDEHTHCTYTVITVM